MKRCWWCLYVRVWLKSLFARCMCILMDKSWYDILLSLVFREVKCSSICNLNSFIHPDLLVVSWTLMVLSSGEQNYDDNRDFISCTITRIGFLLWTCNSRYFLRLELMLSPELVGKKFKLREILYLYIKFSQPNCLLSH